MVMKRATKGVVSDIGRAMWLDVHRGMGDARWGGAGAALQGVLSPVRVVVVFRLSHTHTFLLVHCGHFFDA